MSDRLRRLLARVAAAIRASSVAGWARDAFARRLSVRECGARLWRARRRAAIVLVLFGMAPFVVVGAIALSTPLPAELGEPPAPSVRVLARTGQLLREVRADDGARARPMPLSAFPAHVRDAVIAAEDRRFDSHFGIDVYAVARAAFSNLVHGRVVSGASTITMQLARTLRPHPRSVWGKLKDAGLALRIEAALSKEAILEAYLNRVAYGPNLRGFTAASHAYFGVAPESLSLAGAALVAGLPRGPSLYEVRKRPHLAKLRRDRVLSRMAKAGMIDEAARERATAEPIVTTLDKPAFGAPHLVRAVVAGTMARFQPGLDAAVRDRTGVSEIQTTIDPELQRLAENAVSSTIAPLAARHVTAAASVVVDNATGDVLAYVGSPDFDDAEALGQNDGALAQRQPGSSLKPFVYAEAMSELGYTGATLLPDVELHVPLPGGGDYVPRDYDSKLRGPVRLRDALGNSLNVPAVYVIEQLGTARALERLRAFGFASLTADAEHYGPALVLGAGEVTLVELANAYASLARGGVVKPLRFVMKVVRGQTPTELEPGAPQRVLDERVAAIVTDILSDKSARMSAFGDQNVLELDFDVAAKTGTSKGYRDNVAVGYTRDVTVAVWAGNFDGSPMSDVSGITGAGPIFRAVMEAVTGKRGAPGRLALTRDTAARLGLARTSVCALSGEIPTSACPHRVHEWLPEDDADHAPRCSVHARVRVDRRSGLRLGAGCASEEAEVRVFERWRPPFDAWARQAGRPLVPRSSPECPADDDDPAGAAPRALRITYPFDGARFVADPERPSDLQMLDLRVEPDDPRVEVRVDGALVPSPRRWPLTPGEHTITARLGAVEAEPVRFTVR